MKFPSKAETPLRTDYRPELDVTAKLGAQGRNLLPIDHRRSSVDG